MKARRWLLATIAENAPALAAELGFGLETDEFCTAEHMDEALPRWLDAVRAHGRSAPVEILHAPFAEIYPCAIDPMARAFAMKRMEQAADVARQLGIRRMVAHGGFLPNVYYPEWYEPQAAAFWREFLAGQPEDFELLVENVLEEDPLSMLRMIDAVDDPRAGICLDLGHANVVSTVSVEDWVITLAHRIRHVHLHNNYGDHDTHNRPAEGTIDMPRVLALLDEHAPAASVTIESAVPTAISCRSVEPTVSS